VKNKAMMLAMALLLMLPALAGAVSEKDFEVSTTQNLINLCTASPDDPLYHQAVNFCHGYLVGAYKFYEAEHAGPKAPKLVCMPTPPPTRNQSIKMFIDWAQKHPEFMKEKPVETEFRFLMEKWPCKP
jgi:hypothetical protein